MPYFVKFVPYNQNTLSSLINKTIYFSTVYEFNDFNELAYIGTDCSGKPIAFWNIFKKKFDDGVFRSKMLENAYKAGTNKNECIDEFQRRLATHTQDAPTITQKDYEFISENIVFTSVGIFCVSSLDVFYDDSAQLMFAHYADNLRGLALIYEINPPKGRKIEKIIYNKNSTGPGHPDEWLNDNFSNMDNFTNKSNNWNYENEHRIFYKPGISEVNIHEVSLKAILYTVRFPENEIDVLKTICKNIYNDNVKLQAIIPRSPPEYKFGILYDDSDDALNGKCIVDWVLESFPNEPYKAS
ncbi:MAG: DUF2971 domain-containing protein [Alphaproteobacteria bacterium]|nr:DUF2971 domain-containing protein [Alphaproteobacteria bacterium]